MTSDCATAQDWSRKVRLVGVHRCFSVMADSSFFNVLAIAFLAGEPAVEQIVVRICETIGQSPRWLRPLAQRYVVRFARQTRPRRRDVIQFLRNDPGFQRVWRKHSRELSVEQWLTEAPKMQPVRAAAPWNVPPIESAGDLARWLGVEAGELRWFADLKGLDTRSANQSLITITTGHY
jgi:RNA-directed DNA polymerase